MFARRMGGAVGLLSALIAVVAAIEHGSDAEENFTDTIKLLREQVSALLDHRQEDYNALEESLKRAIEKNTELFVLRNEVKQLRKEVNGLRGGNGNEAKNERLRVRWLGNAVMELQAEVAEVLRARNASEELAERSRMRSEIALLKGDVSEIGRGLRNLGGRITEIEAALNVVRLDVVTVKERSGLLFRSYADVTSQLNAIQVEATSGSDHDSRTGSTEQQQQQQQQQQQEQVQEREEEEKRKQERKQSEKEVEEEEEEEEEEARVRANRRRESRRHDYSRRLRSRTEAYRSRVEDRLRSLERKVALSSRKRASLERRVSSLVETPGESRERSRRLERLERSVNKFSEKLSNLSTVVEVTKNSGVSLGSRVLSSVHGLEEEARANRTETRRELARLGLEGARRAAELSLTREELSGLRRAVQAVSVSVSKLQERAEARDCESWLADAASRAGARPRHPLPVCRDDGWLAVARRIDGTLGFDRDWREYSSGFGSATGNGEFWIGNNLLHRLTGDGCASLALELTDSEGRRWRARYESFVVGSEDTGYRLRVAGYTGNASDALSYQDGMAFSTRDRDSDLSSADCAGNYRGGWWFGRCQRANLNGEYSLGLSWYRAELGEWMSLSSFEMSVRRRANCRGCLTFTSSSPSPLPSGGR